MFPKKHFHPDSVCTARFDLSQHSEKAQPWLTRSLNLHRSNRLHAEGCSTNPTEAQACYSRHSFSSLLSKQSGSPSHCQAPGIHLPLLHMKLPGMLHSLVKLFPGSSWLSRREEKEVRQYIPRRQGCQIILSPLRKGLCT